jgi:hypothetical protein
MCPTNVIASQEVQIEEFVESLSEYTTDIFPELSNKDVLAEIIAGKTIEPTTLWNKIANFFVDELKLSISIVAKILIASVFGSLLKSLGPNNDSSVK